MPKNPVYPPKHDREDGNDLYEDSGLSDEDEDDDNESSDDEQPTTSGVTSSDESGIAASSSSSEALLRSMWIVCFKLHIFLTVHTRCLRKQAK